MNAPLYGIKRKNKLGKNRDVPRPSTDFDSKKSTPYNYLAGLHPQQYGKLFLLRISDIDL